MADSLASRMFGLRGERIRASKQFTGQTFANPSGLGVELKGDRLPLLSEYLLGGQDRTPRRPLPLLDPLEKLSRETETGLRITWLGHSTMLIEQGGVSILTDPVFGLRASPVSFAGPKRFHKPPVLVEKIPKVDVVLLSHDHYDHLCVDSIRALAKRRVPFVTSLGVGARLESLGVDAALITELDWWESATVPDARIRFTATPAQHFSGRSLSDRNLTLWSSWVIESERHRLFFSGDTGLTPQFAEIAKAKGPFDLVMLEVGAFHPSWSAIHLGPENALEAFRLLSGDKPGTLMPVHWGTFNLALHAWDEPAETLFERAKERGVRILTPKLGEVVEPAHVEALPPWWREVG